MRDIQVGSVGATEAASGANCNDRTVALVPHSLQIRKANKRLHDPLRTFISQMALCAT